MGTGDLLGTVVGGAVAIYAIDRFGRVIEKRGSPRRPARSKPRSAPKKAAKKQVKVKVRTVRRTNPKSRRKSGSRSIFDQW